MDEAQRLEWLFERFDGLSGRLDVLAESVDSLVRAVLEDQMCEEERTALYRKREEEAESMRAFARLVFPKSGVSDGPGESR